MNLEFIILVTDYFRTLKRRDFLLEWVIAIAIGVVSYFVDKNNDTILDTLKSVSGNGISLLGVLVGFSVAVITLLVTTNSETITEIKEVNTQYKISNRHISLFDLLLINFCYSVVVEVFLVLINLLLPQVALVIKSNNAINIINSVNIFSISHILLLTMRNITNFYFIFIKKN